MPPPASFKAEVQNIQHGRIRDEIFLYFFSKHCMMKESGGMIRKEPRGGTIIYFRGGHSMEEKRMITVNVDGVERTYPHGTPYRAIAEIGRASCRERV